MSSKLISLYDLAEQVSDRISDKHKKSTGSYRIDTVKAPFGEIKKMPIDELSVLPEVQRQVSESQIVSYGAYDPSIMAYVVVVRYIDSSGDFVNAVVDSQHCTLLSIFAGNTEVECRVYDMTEKSEEEAIAFMGDLFRKSNQQRKSTSEYDSLKVGLACGDISSIKFNSTLRDQGLRAENLGCKLKTSREFIPKNQKVPNGAPKISAYIKALQRYAPHYSEEFNLAVSRIKEQTEGPINDRMVLVMTLITIFTRHAVTRVSDNLVKLEDDGMKVQDFLNWLLPKLKCESITWSCAGDTNGFRCFHLIMEMYETYIENLPKDQKPFYKPLTRDDLTKNSFFHPDKRPSDDDIKTMYKNGEIYVTNVNDLKNRFKKK